MAELPRLQSADIKNKVVLLKVDHNVVKKGRIFDTFRIDRTIGTIFNIVERGGRLVIMSHVGRPRNKKTGEITCDNDTSVEPIVEYLEKKLYSKIHIPQFSIDPQYGIQQIDNSFYDAIERLRSYEIGAIYMPNTRWFKGEEESGSAREKFIGGLARGVDVFINDAFGSWQPHASTYDITKFLPSYAGYLMQEEIKNLDAVLNPQKPFLAIVAGSKYDTKIGPLKEIYKKVDNLILGGVIYNTYLCVKHNIEITGVSEEDKQLARELVEMDRVNKKILAPPFLIESDNLEKREGGYRSISIHDFKSGGKYNFVLDVDPKSFDDPEIKDAMGKAKTIFINAVMGLTPHFSDGSAACYRNIALNKDALKLFGGGDTLQELKNLCPDIYLKGLDNPKYYLFTGGGTVLTAIEMGSPYSLSSIKALMENSARPGS
ncbi:MAG: phosphoglycerate kinase [bacterium]